MWNFRLFPDGASSLSGRVDALYLASVGIAVFFTALICFLILYHAIKYRRGSPADRSNPVTHSTRLEAVWIGVPLAISLGLFALATFVFFELYDLPDNAAEIYVLG